MAKWINIIITCLVFPAIYEILKSIVIRSLNVFKEKSLPYTMTGFWCAHHTAKDEKVEKVFSTFEILDIQQQNTYLTVTIYQYINDGRFYTYKGKGYIRGEKIAISYEEAEEGMSNNTGNITIRREDTYQHRPQYVGIYSEFIRENKFCTSRPYALESLEISKMDKVLLKVLKNRYAKIYMEKASISYYEK